MHRVRSISEMVADVFRIIYNTNKIIQFTYPEIDLVVDVGTTETKWRWINHLEHPHLIYDLIVAIGSKFCFFFLTEASIFNAVATNILEILYFASSELYCCPGKWWHWPDFKTFCRVQLQAWMWIRYIAFPVLHHSLNCLLCSSHSQIHC